MNASRRPCTVGLTGGLASGKSTVARMFGELGAAVIDADTVVHELYREGESGAREVARLFGREILAADGGVDREALAARIATDTDARHRLEAAIHPLVRRKVGEWLQALEGADEPPSVAVVEAALLVETGSFRSYDLLVVVWCPPEQQVERAVSRGMPEDRVRALLAAQLPLAEKATRADVVVDNSGSQTDLGAEVDRVWREILQHCRGGTIAR